MRISDWSSDVCSSDLALIGVVAGAEVDAFHAIDLDHMAKQRGRKQCARRGLQAVLDMRELVDEGGAVLDRPILRRDRHALDPRDSHAQESARTLGLGKGAEQRGMRSEEHTSELPSIMRNPSAVFCL